MDKGPDKDRQTTVLSSLTNKITKVQGDKQFVTDWEYTDALKSMFLENI